MFWPGRMWVRVPGPGGRRQGRRGDTRFQPSVTVASLRFWRFHEVFLAVGAVALLSLLSCGGGIQSLEGKDKAFVEADFWKRAEAMFGEEGGGYWTREKQTEVRYEGGNWFVKERYHYQIVVLDADRLEEYADVSIPFGPSSRLVNVKARTITSAGEVLPVEAGSMHDKSRMPGFTLYSDRRSRVFPMPGFVDRCILDVAYEREDEALYFMDRFEFGTRLPVRNASYSYSLDSRVYMAGFRIYYRSYNVDAKPVDQSYETHFGTMVMWKWDLENIDAYPEERWMPPREAFLPRIALGGFGPDQQPDDWHAFTGWYAKILPKFDGVRPELDEYAQEIADDTEGETEIIQAVLDFIGENTRYVSVDMEDSGWRPHDPREVLENKYGDCKDMSCATVAILRRLGIKAYPALVRTREDGPIDPQLAVPLFNHMIVFVKSDDGDLWLDPTAAPCPVGYVPEMVRDLDALVLIDKDGVWKHTPSMSPYGSTRATLTEITLGPTGMLEGECRTTYSGDMGLVRKRSYAERSPSELGERVEEDIAACFRDVSLDTCWLVGMEEVDPVVRISGHFTKPSAVVRLGDRMVLRLDFLRPMMAGLAEMPRGSERKYPLWIPFGFEEIDTLRIHIPAGWEVAELPIDAASPSKYGAYGVSCAQEGDAVVVLIRNKLTAGEYQGDRFRDFVDFWLQARERAGGDIVFRKL
jgi:hypothetical protein